MPFGSIKNTSYLYIVVISMKHTTTPYNFILFAGLLLCLFCSLSSTHAQSTWKSNALLLLQKKETKALNNWCKQHITYDNTFRDSLDETLSILDSSKNYSLALDIINKGIQTFNYKDLWVDKYIFEQKGLLSKQANSTLQSLLDFINGDDLLTTQLANRFLFYNDEIGAILVYERAISILRNNYVYFGPLSKLYARNNRIPEALETLFNGGIYLPNQAEEIKASLLDIIQNDDLKLRQCQKGVLKKLNEQPNNAFLNELLIWIYTLKNDWDQALVLEEALDTRLQENGQRIFKFIDLALKNNALKPAEEALNYLSSNANRVDAHFVLLKRLAISQSQLKASLGNDTVVRHTLNNLFSQLQKDSIRFFDEGTALDYVSYLTQYEHQYKKALQLVNMCIDRYADQRSLEGNAKLWKGDLLLLLNKPWEASLLYSQVEKAFREDALGEEARYKNAKLAYYTGEFEWAEGQLSVLKTATSELIANDALKLSMLIIENKTNDSVNIAMQAYAKADLFLFQNKPKEALQLIDSICTLNPSHPLQDDFLFLKASVLKSINDFDAAIVALEKIKKEYANDVLADDAINELATIYVYLKKDANAKVCYEELIEKYPGSTFVNNARLFLNKK